VSSDLKRVSFLAVVFLVLLRVSIGWQFLYEGLWKYDTLDTAQPWTSEGYLKNAQGPLRDYFRDMTGDPDDLQWLDHAAMSRKWEIWQQRFVSHYNLTEEQQARLQRLLDGPAEVTAAVETIPESAQAALDKLKGVVTFDADRKLLIVKGDNPLLPSEAQTLKSSVAVVALPDGYARTDATGDAARTETGAAVEPDPLDLRFFKAIEILEKESAKLGFKQRLAASLKGDPDRVGVLARLTEGYRPEMAVDWPASDLPPKDPNIQREQVAGEEAAPPDSESTPDETSQTTTEAREQAAETAQWLRYGEFQVYRDLLREYESARRVARTDFQYEHLELVWQKIQGKRAELVGPVRALEAELKREALNLLTPDQRARGAIPPEQTRVWQADQATIFGLLILGSLLILGFLTRPAAFLGAVMLVMFYLPTAPLPGVYLPDVIAGTEHSYIVNKNLIEAIALLAIAALPTGSWFGIDGIFRWLFKRGTKR
jgi:uncharacterized membrane protein YphA (DoxX/SURF4 family)